MEIRENVIVGMDALELFKTLYVCHDLRLAEVVKYKCEEKPHFDEAKKKNPKAKRSVLSALQHTSDHSEPSIFIKDVWDFSNIQREMAGLKRIDPEKIEVASYVEGSKSEIVIHEALKIVSRVRTSNSICHIPLLDLDIAVEEGGPESIEEVAQGLGISSGAVLDSGRSYHFWGLQLLPDKLWREFMYKTLLLDRIDRRWVGHRLIDGQANLRISEKRGKVPQVVHVF